MRMLGKCDQPVCGSRCCGHRDKGHNRRLKRRERQQWKKDITTAKENS